MPNLSGHFSRNALGKKAIEDFYGKTIANQNKGITLSLNYVGIPELKNIAETLNSFQDTLTERESVRRTTEFFYRLIAPRKPTQVAKLNIQKTHKFDKPYLEFLEPSDKKTKYFSEYKDWGAKIYRLGKKQHKIKYHYANLDFVLDKKSPAYNFEKTLFANPFFRILFLIDLDCQTPDWSNAKVWLHTPLNNRMKEYHDTEIVLSTKKTKSQLRHNSNKQLNKDWLQNFVLKSIILRKKYAGVITFRYIDNIMQILMRFRRCKTIEQINKAYKSKKIKKRLKKLSRVIRADVDQIDFLAGDVEKKYKLKEWFESKKIEYHKLVSIVVVSKIEDFLDDFAQKIEFERKRKEWGKKRNNITPPRTE